MMLFGLLASPALTQTCRKDAFVHITATQLVDVAVAHAGAFSKVTLTS